MRLVLISEHARHYNDWIGHFEHDTISSVPLTFESVKLDNQKYEEIVAFGSGRVIDYGKLYAQATSLRLTVIPTAIATDCLFTEDAAIRKNSSISYVKAKRPDRIILDTNLILRNRHMCNYGWLEIISAFTTRHYTLKTGIKKAIAHNSKVIDLLRYLEPVSDERTLFQLIWALSTEVGLCERNGSALLVEEGIEHYLAYELENMIKQRLPHGLYLSVAINFLLPDSRHLRALGLPKDYKDYGLTSEEMKKAIDRAHFRLAQDIKRIYGVEI